MFDYSRVRNYYIACGYTDMRKQIDGLVALVELQYGKKADETSWIRQDGKLIKLEPDEEKEGKDEHDSQGQ